MDNLLALIVPIIAIVGSVGTLAGWMAKKFSSMERLVFDRSENTQKMLIDKLEYHERHDDKRFELVTTGLWEIRLNQALGKKVVDQETIDRATGT